MYQRFQMHISSWGTLQVIQIMVPASEFEWLFDDKLWPEGVVLPDVQDT